MKWLFIIGILLALLIVSWGLFLFHENCYFTTPTKTYATLEQAVNEGVISNGWLPDFLPRSARNIREKHNYEQNTVIAAFAFDPAEDMAPMLREAEQLPTDSLKAIRPSVICRREKWFPSSIIKGEFDKLSSKGFKIYRIDLSQRRIISHWYLAVHQTDGVCYLWMLGTSRQEKGAGNSNSAAGF